MIKIHIESGSLPVKPELTYVLQTWANNQQAAISFVENADDALVIGATENSTLKLSHGFNFERRPTLNNAGIIHGAGGQPDYLATAFYMMNSLQEWNDNDRDELNRFKYGNSYQFKFRNVKDNIVQACFDAISKQMGRTPRVEKTRFFLTHDIDMVHGAIIEDGFNVLKKGRADLFLKMLFNIAVGKPDWLNMDKIMAMEDAYDFKSVFFWIVNKGKINNREKNADYAFPSASIQRQVNAIEHSGTIPSATGMNGTGFFPATHWSQM